MVAKLNSAKRMLTILNYNENKVKEGKAICIHENLFGCPIDKLTFHDKLRGLEFFTDRNQRATSKSVHISLNFHPDEKISESTLTEISGEYMDRIGFHDQPYLVYQHFDAGHPHVHIVTTNIQRDGSRIKLFRRGKYESERARQAIEKKYHLIEAMGRKQKSNTNDIHQISYGKTELRRNISNVVRAIVDNYNFTSLPEFNAVLSQFNIVADRGKEQSTMFTKKGLHYRVLDDNGKKIGVPIKASLLVGQPTLTFLERRFNLNHRLRKPTDKDRIVKCIDTCFGNRNSITKSAFVNALNHQSIYVLFRQNDEGRIYGITFVDNIKKVVFNGSGLGKAYGAKAITERLTNLSAPRSVKVQPNLFHSQPDQQAEKDLGIEQAIKDLTLAKQFDYTSPDSTVRTRRTKRRGRSI